MVTTRRQSSTPASSAKKGRKSKAAAADADDLTPNGGDDSISSVASTPATPTPAPRTRTKSNAKKSLLSNGSSGSTKISKKKQELLAPKTEHYEFGGPFGAFFVSTTVPFFSYLLYYGCNEAVGCALLPRYPKLIFQQMADGVLKSFTDTTAFAIYFGWYAFVVLAWAVLPGKWEDGLPLRTGEKLSYKINAFVTLLASVAVSAGIIYAKGPETFAILYDHWPGLTTASLVMSLLQAFYVYAASFGEGKLLAKGGNSGNHLFDWFIGRELNPRIGIFDIKTFNELRPGLILWLLLDIGCACKQWVELNGRITDSMVLVTFFHGWYVFDALFNESAIFSQMDITTDGFGFMLSVGDLTWVPFVYSLQARYLVFTPLDLGLLATAGVLIVQLAGYYMFRDSNGEKNDFRSGKNPKNLTFMTTKSGRKLLTSGWWGWSRHPNYAGDLLMALAWSLPTGFTTPITYFYVAYFTVLLVHRQMRDDEACKEKYGADWDKYCKIVPYRIIRYVY